MPRSETMSKYGKNERLAIKPREPCTLIEPDIFGPSQLTMLPLHRRLSRLRLDGSPYQVANLNTGSRKMSESPEEHLGALVVG